MNRPIVRILLLGLAILALAGCEKANREEEASLPWKFHKVGVCHESGGYPITIWMIGYGGNDKFMVVERYNGGMAVVELKQ